jgi:hypothetical protein
MLILEELKINNISNLPTNYNLYKNIIKEVYRSIFKKKRDKIFFVADKNNYKCNKSIKMNYEC